MRYGEEILFTMTGGRQMKKKILAAILTAAMTIGMVGCGSTSSSDNGNNSA